MKIVDIEEKLGDLGLLHPELSALKPNEAEYHVALYQPTGPVEVDSKLGVRVTDPELRVRAQQFLEFASAAELELKSENMDIAVAPEYSIPIDTLVDAIGSGAVPAPGAIWILGCEAIPRSDLDARVAELSKLAKVVSEDVGSPKSEKFVNPLAYVFWSSASKGGKQQLVIVLQFKTKPMADRKNFEVGGMICGSTIYRFGIGHEVKLATLICADTLGIDNRIIDELYDGSLIFHLQLNPGYRDPKYRQYRDTMFFPECDRTELVCLNWSSPVDAGGVRFDKLGGSAWYLRPSQFDNGQASIDLNDKGGLYYTWFDPGRAHALFLNRAPGIYVLSATKARHHGISTPGTYPRRGPTAKAVLGWDPKNSNWRLTTPDSGFLNYAGLLGDASTDLSKLIADSPMKGERIINLSIGGVDSEDWWVTKKLPPVRIEQIERIFRFAYCQDDDDKTQKDRELAFKQVGELWAILDDSNNLPQAVRDLASSRRFEWTQSSPHQNIIGPDGAATVVYVADALTAARVSSLGKRLQLNLHRSSDDEHQSRRFQQRLVLLHREAGKVRHWSPDLTKVDDPDEQSPVDIGDPS